MRSIQCVSSSSCYGNGWDCHCPWQRNIARSLLQAPKVYFTDTCLVKGDLGVRFTNAVAVMLRKQVHHLAECKLADSSPHRALSRFVLQLPEAEAVQLVRDARQQEQRGAVAVVPVGEWLARLPV